MSGTLPGAVSGPREGDAFIRVVHSISRLCGVAAAGLLIAALLVTCHMIIVRSFLGQSTIWQTETVIYLTIGAICIGLPYVQMLRGHVNVDLIPLAMGPKLRLIWMVLILIVSIVVVAMIAWYSWEYLHQAWKRNWKSPTVWAPRIWFVWTAMPLGFGLLLLQLIADLWGQLRGYERPFWLEGK
ncbi:TRAP transporter small permease [Falsigemmobacter intermedius]|uniref:TRAP transporter small permease n=1 Tax=Falsigemmobacter intermedius TaxID=1553448 RepID=UPI003F061B46